MRRHTDGGTRQFGGSRIRSGFLSDISTRSSSYRPDNSLQRDATNWRSICYTADGGTIAPLAQSKRADISVVKQLIKTIAYCILLETDESSPNYSRHDRCQPVDRNASYRATNTAAEVVLGGRSTSLSDLRAILSCPTLSTYKPKSRFTARDSVWYRRRTGRDSTSNPPLLRKCENCDEIALT